MKRKKATKKPPKYVKTGIFTTNLRLPESVAEAVKERARQMQRSLNGQIVYELNQK